MQGLRAIGRATHKYMFSGWGQDGGFYDTGTQPTMTVEDLTSKQTAFVDAIISGANGAVAYVTAGYTAPNTNTATAGASRLLANVKISTAIARLKAGTAELVDVSQSRLVAEFWDTYHAARQLDTPNLTAARQCLDSLARITGLFDAHSTVDVQHSGTVNHLQSVSLETLEELLFAIDQQSQSTMLAIEASDSEDSNS